jgi:hypothetical protein
MKKLLLILNLLLLSIIASSQEYRDIVINGGVSDNNDFSILVGSRFTNNRLYVSTEYSHNQKTSKNGGLIGVGLIGKIAIVSIKAGISYFESNEYPIQYPNPSGIYNPKMDAEFDYGLEFLWLADNITKSTLCYGISATHINGLQLKFGVAF